MDLIWLEGRSLSSSEIVELLPDRSWKEGSIHILLNQLLQKEVICVDGFVKTGRNYGRTFAATLTEQEYQTKMLKSGVVYKKAKEYSLCDFVATLFEGEKLDKTNVQKLKDLLDTKIGE